MTIDHLNLAPLMAQRATELQLACPSVQYLSGRRDLASQAHAMACDVVSNRQFIAKTYLHAAELQTAVDAHPDAKTVQEIQDVLYGTLTAMSPQELSGVSDHLSGYAVDLLPMEDAQGQMTPSGRDVYTWIHDCPDTKQFLVREAGLVRWHWATKAPVTTEV